MDLDARLALNLRVLQRFDPGVCEILGVASFAVLYSFDKAWTKTGTEGPLFFYRRTTAPHYALQILNRNAPENFSVGVSPQDDIELSNEFIIYAPQRGEVPGDDDDVYGIWIFEPSQLKQLGDTIRTSSVQREPYPTSVPEQTASIDMDALFAPTSVPQHTSPVHTEADRTGASILNELFWQVEAPGGMRHGAASDRDALASAPVEDGAGAKLAVAAQATVTAATAAVADADVETTGTAATAAAIDADVEAAIATAHLAEPVHEDANAGPPASCHAAQPASPHTADGTPGMSGPHVATTNRTAGKTTPTAGEHNTHAVHTPSPPGSSISLDALFAGTRIDNPNTEASTAQEQPTATPATQSSPRTARTPPPAPVSPTSLLALLNGPSAHLPCPLSRGEFVEHVISRLRTDARFVDELYAKHLGHHL
ncbi:hypothetical protein MSPP1_001807 [Malassezia sp. CBS 17886]|nr:hypothetical protein MSPP1_001807 [Malassezia sp. CBS 17886]